MPSSPGDRAPKRNNARLEWRGSFLSHAGTGCTVAEVCQVAANEWIATIYNNSNSRFFKTRAAGVRHINRRFGLKESPHG